MKLKQPVLSISILISGREEMQKCLESLRLFLEELNCELILVDTGCNEEQLAIARKYTDIIVPFTWCNDFSAARNAGLEKATGEWFMFLDDDEWFEDPSEIVSFFKSGEYKKYNAAYYKVRSHVDHSGKNYVDGFVSRMVKKESRTRFKGKIHEELLPFCAPTKTFQTHAEHYGYVYSSKEEKRRHSERNIPPLLEEIKENPDNLRWYAQLSQEYLSIEEYEKGAEVALKGVQRYESTKKRDEIQYRIYAALYGFAVLHYFNMDDINRAEELLKIGLEKIKGVKPGRAHLLQCAARIYEKLKCYPDCISAAGEYLDMYDAIGSDDKLLAKDGFLITESTFHEDLRVPVILCGTLAAAAEKKYDELEKFFFRLDWQDPRMLNQQEVEKYIMDAVIDVPCRDSFVHMIEIMGERKGGMSELYPIFLEIEKKCKERAEEEKLNRLHKLVAEIDSEHFYVKMAKIYCLDKQEDRRGIEEILHEIFEREESVLDVKEDIWKVVERNQISLEQFFQQMDFVKWKHALEKWVYIAPFEEAESWERRCREWNCKEDNRYLLLKIRCGEVMIRQKGIKEDITTLEERLGNYAREVLSYYQRFFKEEVFMAAPEVLPDEARLSLHYLDVIEKRKAGDARSILQALRDMLEIYPVLEEATLYYAGLVKDEVERKNNEAENTKLELEVLINSLKTMAKLQIRKKEFGTAREILMQIKQCAPDDAEVDEMLEQIG